MLNPIDQARTALAERDRTGQGDGPTPERLVKAGPDTRLIDATAAPEDEDRRQKRSYVLMAPLDRLQERGIITSREFEAGDKYRTDAFLAKIDPAAPSVDWGSLGGNFGPRIPSQFQSQSVADARARWREVQKFVGGVVKTVLELALIRENSLEEIGRAVFARSRGRDAAVAGQAAVRVALGSLADYYRV